MVVSKGNATIPPNVDAVEVGEKNQKTHQSNSCNAGINPIANISSNVEEVEAGDKNQTTRESNPHTRPRDEEGNGDNADINPIVVSHFVVKSI